MSITDVCCLESVCDSSCVRPYKGQRCSRHEVRFLRPADWSAHSGPEARVWPGPIANASNLVTTFETASVNNDSNLFLHSNVLRNNLIPLRSVFQTSYFKNSDLLYNITPMQILRKICCLYTLVELTKNDCTAVTYDAS